MFSFWMHVCFFKKKQKKKKSGKLPLLTSNQAIQAHGWRVVMAL
jgi:hypothetical protein